MKPRGKPPEAYIATMPRSFVEREHVLTGAWRDTHSPPRYSDVALQLIVYNKANALKNSYKSFPDAIPPKTPQERRDLVEALSNPMVYHRWSKSFSRLRAAIRYFIRVRYFLHDAKNKEGWDKYVAIALRRADHRWASFEIAFASMNRDDILEAGGTSGMWKEDKRRRQAVGVVCST